MPDVRAVCVFEMPQLLYNKSGAVDDTFVKIELPESGNVSQKGREW